MPAKSIQKPDNEKVHSHIYNKGVEAKIIFNDEQDYEVFLGYLKDYLTPPADPESIKQAFTVNGRLFRGVPHQPKNYFNQVELIAYCLMPNHFHLLLHQKTTGSIENFIKSLCIRYSIYFNKKYQRTGTLFGGRYKCIRIDNPSHLRLLTRYFHQAGGYSSYPEYLSKRHTPWVNTNVVLSLQKDSQSSYQDFVDKSQLDPTEQKLLEGIILESKSEHFEPKTPVVASDLQPQSHFPALIASVVAFVLLVALGIRNINASAAKTVLGATATATPSVAPSANPATLPPEPETAAVQSKALVVIKLDNPSLSVNIHQDPTADSAKIGKARDGDTFEFVSENSGWYEVKLPDSSTGFISANYAVKEESPN